MQKMKFMALMDAIILASLDLGVIAEQMNAAGEEKLAGSIKEQAEEVNNKAHRTLKAFFSSNGEKGYKIPPFSSNVIVRMAKKGTFKNDLKIAAAEVVSKMSKDIEVLKELKTSVRHDSGKAWNRTKTDIARIKDIDAASEAIVKLLS